MIIYQEITKLPQNLLSINTIARTMGLISQEKLSGMYIANPDSYEEPQFYSPIYSEEGNWLEDGHLTCQIAATLTCFRTSVDDRPDTDWFMDFFPTTYTAPILDAVRCAGYIDQGNEGMNLKIGNDTQSDTKGVNFGNDFTSGMIYVIKGGYADEDGNITYVDLTNNSAENNLREGYLNNPSTYSIRNLSSDFPYNVYPFGGMVAHDGEIRVKTNFKLFTTKAAMDAYLKTGIAIDPINEGGEPIKIDTRPEHKYISSSTCHTDISSKSGEYTVTHVNKLDMYNSDLARTETPERWVAGWIDDATEEGYNIRIKLRDVAEEYFKYKEDRDGVIIEGNNPHYINPKNPDEEIKPLKTLPGWTYIDLFGGSGDYYFGKLSTNIPIFTSEEKADDYLDGNISEGESLNGGGNYSGASSDIGEDMSATDYNDSEFDGVMSRAFIFGNDALEDIAGILYDEDEIDNLIEGLKMNGDNPLSFICDLYYVPFDMGYFCDSSASLSTFHFGTYEKELAHTFKRVNQNNIRRTMFTQQITGSFNDFRDYYANYYLYLPYVGITQLDTQMWLYSTLRVDVCVDVYTGDIKYYLMNNDRLMDIREGSLRVTMPISSADKYGGAVGRVTSAISLIENAGAGASSALMGDVSGAAHNGGNAIKSTFDLVKATPKQMNGNYSSSVAVNDPLDAFLIIEQKEIEYPDNLKANYGIPDNDICSLGTKSGYIECDNVLLKCNCMASEYDEILSLASGGIIV